MHPHLHHLSHHLCLVSTCSVSACLGSPPPGPHTVPHTGPPALGLTTTWASPPLVLPPEYHHLEPHCLGALPGSHLPGSAWVSLVPHHTWSSPTEPPPPPGLHHCLGATTHCVPHTWVSPHRLGAPLPEPHALVCCLSSPPGSCTWVPPPPGVTTPGRHAPGSHLSA
ncbi:hypothetical protein GPJ56_007215 [Histomonas meleagridis]|nr:hypothetical protein GPJ56_007215 [Histomonas meleagridis]